MDTASKPTLHGTPQQRSPLSTAISPEATVNDVLLQHPATVAVFNAFGIDACCGGDASIAEAALRDGADLEKLMAALDAVTTSEAKSGAR